jgi:hypothetical protein
MPTRNGATIAPHGIVLYASALWVAEKLRPCTRYVPMVTNHAPHTKNCRNIIADSFPRTAGDRVGLILRTASSISACDCC